MVTLDMRWESVSGKARHTLLERKQNQRGQALTLAAVDVGAFGAGAGADTTRSALVLGLQDHIQHAVPPTWN